MRILIVTAPPWAGTGYGVAAKALSKRLLKEGHTLAWLPMGGFGSAATEIDGITFLNQSVHDVRGNHTIVAHAKAWEADLVYTLYDAWILERYGGANFRWVAHAPVDGDPIGKRHKAQLQKAWKVLAMSQHGAQAMRDAGLEPTYIPLGYEADTYYPDEKMGKLARKVMNIPEDAFVIGSVGLNYRYPGRKGFDRLLEAFSIFAKGKENVYLYVHTNPQANESLDLNEVCDEFGLGDQVVFAKPYSLLVGYKDDAMRGIYNAMDVHVLATQGEGFGVPVVESLACGIPQIATDCTSMRELITDKATGILVPPITRYMNTGYYFHYLIDVDKLVQALEDMYEQHDVYMGEKFLGREYAARMPHLKRLCTMTAKPYQYDRIFETHWRPFLRGIEKEIARDKAAAGAVEEMGLDKRSSAVVEFHDGFVRKYDGPLANVEMSYNILKTLDHPGIIKPIGCGRDEFGRFYMDLPRYRGSLDRTIGYDPEKVLAGVDAALNYLHDQGWAHRDVHPSNVVLTSDDEPILIDFGWIDKCPGRPCVDFRPWEVPQRAVPTVQRGIDQRGYHTIVMHARGISLEQAKATGLPGVPYQSVDGIGERDCEPRWKLMAPDVAGKKVLDIGCNLGWFANRALLEGAQEAIGVDGDRVTIEAGRKLHPNVDLRVGDLNNGGLPDEKFDVAFALSVLQHLKRPQEVLNHLKKNAEVVYVEVPDGVVDLEGGVVLGTTERKRKVVRFG